MQDVAISLAVGFVAGFILGYMACLLPMLIEPGAGRRKTHGDPLIVEPMEVGRHRLETTSSKKEKAARKVRTIKTKVAGVSFENGDGSSRQSIILRHAADGRELVLMPEPDNEHDPYAIGVWLKKPFKQIGYLNSDLAERLHGSDDLKARILQVTGRDEGLLGVNIEIIHRR